MASTCGRATNIEEGVRWSGRRRAARRTPSDRQSFERLHSSRTPGCARVYAAPRPRWTQLAHRRIRNWGGLPLPPPPADQIYQWTADRLRPWNAESADGCVKKWIKSETKSYA